MQTYLVFAVLLWWAIEWVKRYLVKFSCPKMVQEIIVLILALGGGLGLSIYYKFDLLMLLGVQENNSIVGQVFAGLGIASGSGGVYELLKAIKNIGSAATTEPVNKEA
ncbi:MAG: hypothetical protein QM308_05470 [Bacillota bacterium]|nr:hypothetical protein [Bacillota bacterium]